VFAHIFPDCEDKMERSCASWIAFLRKTLSKRESEREQSFRKTISLHVVARVLLLPLAEYAAMLPTIPKRINSVTETRSRVVTPNITRAANEYRCVSPVYHHSHIYIYIYIYIYICL